MNYRRFNILSVNISAINMNNACESIEKAIIEGKKIYISVCPVSTIMGCQQNKDSLKSVNSADLVTPDGMPIVWLGKFKGYGNIKRVYGPDLMLKMCEISQIKGYRNYFYGSSQFVLSRLEQKIKEKFSDLIISGSFSPSFCKSFQEEDREIIEMINNSNCDILWVALGSPKQDIWMHKHRNKLKVPVIIGVGAAFDFIAETKKQAPRWMQGVGLEWLFRLINEPGRLWRRYLLGNFMFLFLLLKKFIKRESD